MMRTGTSLLSVLLLTSVGAASAQQPEQQPGAQPDQQPGAQPGQQQQGQAERERERDREIAAADRPQSGDFLTRMEQNQIRSNDLEGSNLLDSQGEDIGNVDGILLDQQSGEIAGLLVNLGGVVGVGARNVALSWDAVEIMRRQEDGGVFADRYEVHTQLSRQDFENAPEFEEEGDDQVALGQ